jgi:hypothetical protein
LPVDEVREMRACDHPVTGVVVHCRVVFGLRIDALTGRLDQPRLCASGIAWEWL